MPWSDYSAILPRITPPTPTEIVFDAAMSERAVARELSARRMLYRPETSGALR